MKSRLMIFVLLLSFVANADSEKVFSRCTFVDRDSGKSRSVSLERVIVMETQFHGCPIFLSYATPTERVADGISVYNLHGTDMNNCIYNSYRAGGEPYFMSCFRETR